MGKIQEKLKCRQMPANADKNEKCLQKHDEWNADKKLTEAGIKRTKNNKKYHQKKMLTPVKIG